MTKINQLKSTLSNKVFWMKNLLLTSMLGLTLSSCYNDSDKDPKYVRQDEKKEISLPNNKKVWLIKDWSDTGSPSHFKDEDGNRLLGGLDIDSYSDLGDGKVLVIADDQKGIYDFATNSYILKLDNYINIDKIQWWSLLYAASKIIWWQTIFDTINIDTRAVTYGQMTVEHEPSPASNHDISSILVLWDSLTAVPSGSTWWEFYDIKDAHDSTLVENCYKPINRWTYVYAVTGDELNPETSKKTYVLYTINTSTNKMKVRKIDEYEAHAYLP